MEDGLNADIWTIVPVRGIASGKSRLATVLAAPARAALNRWLLRHTLAVIRQWRGDLQRCVVISPCGEVLVSARRAGAHAVMEPRGAGDLPEVTARSLAEFAAAANQPRQLTLAMDTVGTGTNALLVDAGGELEFHFGEDSCARHREWAAARGWTSMVCRRTELAFDLDTPRDLARWSGSDGAAEWSAALNGEREC
jgi:2-phospho-L-lactate guanylyltransferase (CobY/MobA/RfbA family)